MLEPILAMPWKYAFDNYIFKPGKNTGSILQSSKKTTLEEKFK
jgi:hypothetical protein